jgi:ABC-type bacteriocin/lantibiotic exporter with double-glycine peptidase domain
VLDEATSALDAETEERVLRSLGELRGRCTVLMITHRMAPREIADLVIEL